MPAVIKRFLEDGTYENILSIQRQLVFDYEEDISKYAEGMDKAKIKNIYRHIPVFLAQENKKFQITKVAKNARNREYVGCADWLKDAGVVNLCHCLNDACLPLKGNYDMAKYKMYYHDTGLLIANLDEVASEDLRKNKNLGAYKGAIYENLIPVEVKAKDGATASLNNLISFPSYSDIKFGIKLAHKNIGFNQRFYTIPHFCAFLLKRFLNQKICKFREEF